MDVPEGRIDLGSPVARQFGFTEDRFGGYLWRSGKYIWISVVISWDQGNGHFSKLLNEIEKAGFGIKVPDPSPHMKTILKGKGFQEVVDREQGPFRHYKVERATMIKKPSKITVARSLGRQKDEGGAVESQRNEESACERKTLQRHDSTTLAHYKGVRPI